MSENVTRQTIPLDPLNPEDHLDAGYEGEPSNSFAIPSCGIADADGALKNLFFKDVGFTTRSNAGPNKNLELKKPLIIFATGERWAMAKKLHPPRDKNKMLLLPAISIRRTGFEQTKEDIAGRGINQSTGYLTIKRKLSEFDSDYQNMLNKLALKNMTNLPTTSNRGPALFEHSNTPETKSGGLLNPNIGSNVWEIITVPQPQFFTTTYEVVFWTQYTIHMNEMIEKFVSSYLPQEKSFKLQTDKGYWFMAYVEDSFQNSDNLDDIKDSERVIRYTITMKVKGYILAPNGDTDLVPVRRWVSSPSISFDVSDYGNAKQLASTSKLNKSVDMLTSDKFALSDVQSDTKQAQTKTTTEKLTATKKISNNPTTYKNVSVLQVNEKKGETIYRASSFSEFEKFINK
jgi:hypothetical protein